MAVGVVTETETVIVVGGFLAADAFASSTMMGQPLDSYPAEPRLVSRMPGHAIVRSS